MFSLSHFVRGHSHIPERSGFDMSDAMNSAGVRPERFSHSGVLPAEGAMRSGADSRVEERAVVRTVDWGAEKALAAERVDRRATVANFMLYLMY